MIALGTVAAFALLEFTLSLIPGPAVLIVISTTLQRGRARGLAAAVGILTGNALYFLLSAAGVVALLVASYQAFTIVKWAGAAYLAFLGLRSLFSPEPPPTAKETGNAEGRKRAAFSSGFVTQVANPKAIVFFVAILPQFVDPHRNLAAQIAILTITSLFVELGVLSAYIIATNRLRKSSIAERSSRWIERAGGAILLAIAAGIAREPLARLR